MAKQNCTRLLQLWAQQRGARVRSAASLRTGDKAAPHSELCMQVRCAGKRVRAFAVKPGGHLAAIVWSDSKGCHFTDGLPSEVLPFGMRAGAGLSGAGRRRRRRRR